jgi:hypothetical protein
MLGLEGVVFGVNEGRTELESRTFRMWWTLVCLLRLLRYSGKWERTAAIGDGDISQAGSISPYFQHYFSTGFG